jgi:hypothetical protein
MRSQGFDAKGHSILYHSATYNAFVFVGKDPIPDSSHVTLDELDLSKPLRIKLRPTGEDTSQHAKSQAKETKQRDVIESLVNAQNYSHILSAARAEEDPRHSYGLRHSTHGNKGGAEREK